MGCKNFQYHQSENNDDKWSHCLGQAGPGYVLQNFQENSIDGEKDLQCVQHDATQSHEPKKGLVTTKTEQVRVISAVAAADLHRSECNTAILSVDVNNVFQASMKVQYFILAQTTKRKRDHSTSPPGARKKVCLNKMLDNINKTSY